MTISQAVIDASVLRYGRERDLYLKLAARVADLASTEIVEKNTIRAQVTSRTKSIRSFEGKLKRFAKSGKKSFETVEQVFDEISDFAGVRIATYRPEDQKLVEEGICRVFRGVDDDLVVPEHKANLDFSGAKFYRAVHCQICLTDDELVGEYDNLGGVSCEIQVCSMMAHVWNEIEHDIAYKPEGSGPETVEKGLLESLGHLTCSGDAIITRLLEATENRLQLQTGDFADVHDFVARLRNEFQGLELSVNAGVAYEIAQMLKLDNPGRIHDASGTLRKNLTAGQERLNEFNTFLQRLSLSEYQLNAGSADVLSVALLDNNAPQVASAMNSQGSIRPSRAIGLARRYGDFLGAQGDISTARNLSTSDTDAKL